MEIDNSKNCPLNKNDPIYEKDQMKTYITDNPLSYQGAMAIYGRILLSEVLKYQWHY